MKYAHINKTSGEILGWHCLKINKTIPKPYIKVEEGEWEKAINNSHNHCDSKGITSSKDFRTNEEKREDVKKDIKNAVNNHILKIVKEFGFDSIDSIGKYVGYDNPYRVKSESMGKWIASCWIFIDDSELIEETLDDIIDNLPSFNI